MYHFESDYLEGCCPQILEALRETNLEQTLGADFIDADGNYDPDMYNRK